MRLLRYFTPSLLTKALLESSAVRDTVAKCTYTYVHSPARDAATHLQRCPNNQRSTSLSLTGLMHSTVSLYKVIACTFLRVQHLESALRYVVVGREEVLALAPWAD